MDLTNPQWWLDLGQSALQHWYYVTGLIGGLMVAVRLCGARAIEKGAGLIADICRSLRGEATAATWRFAKVQGESDPSVLVQDGTGYTVRLSPDGKGELIVPGRTRLSRRERKGLAAAIEFALAKKMVAAPQSAPVTYSYGPPDEIPILVSRAELEKIREEWLRTFAPVARATFGTVGPVAQAQSAPKPPPPKKT